MLEGVIDRLQADVAWTSEKGVGVVGWHRLFSNEVMLADTQSTSNLEIPA